MNPAANVDNVLYPLRCYSDKTRLRNDAIALVNFYRELRPNVAPAPGGREPLFNVTGTIPVIIKAVKYNIPVRIWIPVQYPYLPPLVYVTPAPGMSITPNHPNVSPGGVVTLPYIQTWNPATHNLVPLVQAMCQVFGQKTPVYSGGPARQQPPSAYGSYPGAGSGYGGYPNSQPQPQPPQRSSYSPYSSQPQPGPYPPSQPAQPAQPAQPRHRPPPKTPMDIKRDQLRERCRSRIRDLTKEDLTAKTERLEREKREKENMFNSASSQKEQMKKEIADLTQKIKELDDFLAKNSGELDVDKVTDPRDVHKLQLIQSVATDIAIEDVLYHFDRALLKGVIGLDEYLKLCRQYSNDQFYQRALTKRIRETIAAPPAR